MNFVGKAQALTSGGLLRAANSIGVTVPEFQAVLDVETAGCGFLQDRRPIILFERHIFSRRTGGVWDKTNPLVSNSIPGGYGATGAYQYERLEKAMALHHESALYSASWGMGQIMGFNYRRAGYTSPYALINDFVDSEDAQVFAVAAFIKRAGLADELKAHDFSSFAYGYNGPGFAKSDYDLRLKWAYEKRRNSPPLDCNMRTIQLGLWFQGFYKGKMDGVCGPLTLAAIEKTKSEISFG